MATGERWPGGGAALSRGSSIGLQQAAPGNVSWSTMFQSVLLQGSVYLLVVLLDVSERLPDLRQRHSILLARGELMVSEKNRLGRKSRRDVPGSRLLPHYRAAVLQSGSPPGSRGSPPLPGSVRFWTGSTLVEQHLVP